MNLKNVIVALLAAVFLHYCSMPREIRTDPSGTGDAGNTGASSPKAEPPPPPATQTQKKATPAVRPATSKTTGDIGENIRSVRIGEVFETGMATWYGQDFHGRRTASGEIYDMYKLTAAHKTLPFNTLVEVENLDNGKKVVVRINDRGPFVKERVLDLSFKAAQKLNTHSDGVSPVRLRVISPEMVGDGTSAPDIAVTMTRESTTETSPPQPTGTKISTPSATETDTPSDSATPPESGSSPEIAAPGDNPGLIRISSRYFLQAGAFGDRNNAERMMRKIRDILPGERVEIREINGLFKITAGPAPTRAQAESIRQTLKNNRIEAFIREE